MYKAIKDENNKIIQFIPTTYETVDIETRAEKPKDEIDFDWVEKVKEQDGKSETYWVKVERPLTQEEKVLIELKQQKQSINDLNNLAIELMEGGEK